jgi:hypothetical protein
MKKGTGTQLKELVITMLLGLPGIGIMAWGANLSRASGSFVFFPGGLVALAGIALLVAAFYYHYRTDFKNGKGRKAFARYMALVTVNGFLAMLAARLLFRR